MDEIQRERRILLHNIAQLRKQHGISKKEMAKRLGIGLRSYNKIEKGELPPKLSAAVLFRIQDEFGIQPKDLFRMADLKVLSS